MLLNLSYVTAKRSHVFSLRPVETDLPDALPYWIYQKDNISPAFGKPFTNKIFLVTRNNHRSCNSFGGSGGGGGGGGGGLAPSSAWSLSDRYFF